MCEQPQVSRVDLLEAIGRKQGKVEQRREGGVMNE